MWNVSEAPNEILINGFPVELTKAALEYFMKIGEVLELCIRPTEPVQCAIRFRDSNCAAVALIDRYHKLGEITLLVEPSQKSRVETVASKTEIDIPEWLNYDCLIKILNFVNIQKKLQLPETRKHILKRDINELKSISEWHQYFKAIGKFFQNIELSQSIEIQTGDDFKLEFIKEFCKNVESFKFKNGLNLSTRLLNGLNVSHITKMELYNCDLEDSDLAALNKTSKLKQLCLAKNTKLTGQQFPKLNNIQNLILYGCTNMREDVFKACWNLRCLDIRGTALYKVQFDDLIVMEELKTLKLNVPITAQESEMPKMLSHFPELKYLDIEFANENKETLEFMKRHANTLEVLKVKSDIVFDCSSFKKLHTLWMDAAETDVMSDLAPPEKLRELYINCNFNYQMSLVSLVPGIEKMKGLKRLGVGFQIHECLFQSMLQQMQQNLIDFRPPVLRIYTHQSEEYLKRKDLIQVHTLKYPFPFTTPELRGTFNEDMIYDINDEIIAAR